MVKLSKNPKGMYKALICSTSNGLFVEIDKPVFFVSIKIGTPRDIVQKIVKNLLKGKEDALLKLVKEGYLAEDFSHMDDLTSAVKDKDAAFTMSDLINAFNRDAKKKIIWIGYDNHGNSMGVEPKENEVEYDEDEEEIAEEDTDTKKIVVYASGDSPQIVSSRFQPYVIEVPAMLIGNQEMELTIRNAIFKGDSELVKKLHKQGIIKNLQQANLTEDMTLAEFYHEAKDKKIAVFLDEKNNRAPV